MKPPRRVAVSPAIVIPALSLAAPTTSAPSRPVELIVHPFGHTAGNADLAERTCLSFRQEFERFGRPSSPRTVTPLPARGAAPPIRGDSTNIITRSLRRDHASAWCVHSAVNGQVVDLCGLACWNDWIEIERVGRAIQPTLDAPGRWTLPALAHKATGSAPSVPGQGA